MFFRAQVTGKGVKCLFVGWINLTCCSGDDFACALSMCVARRRDEENIVRLERCVTESWKHVVDRCC